MSADDLDEMPEQWDYLFSTTDEIGVALALDDMGYDPEEYEELSREAQEELANVAAEYNEVQNAFQRRDELDREMAEELVERQKVLKKRVEGMMGPEDKKSKWTRRGVGAGIVGLLLGGIVDYTNVREEDSDFSGHFNEGPTNYGKNDFDGAGLIGEQPDQAPRKEDYQLVEASINDVDAIGNYLEGLSKRERDEWSTLWNVYDPEENEFFSGQDNINLDGVEIVFNEDPGTDSKYHLVSTIDGNRDVSDPQHFEHDSAAENALKHFGEL